MTNVRDRHVMSILLELLRDGAHIEVDQSDWGTRFFELGLDSLFLTQFSVSLNNRLGSSLTFRQVSTELDCLSKLAAYLEGGHGNAPAPMPSTRVAQMTPIKDPSGAREPRPEAKLHVAPPLSSDVSDPLISLFLSQIAVIQQQLDALSHAMVRHESEAQPETTDRGASAADGAGEFRKATLRPLEAAPGGLVLDATRPPVPEARLGRDRDGKPAWFIPEPGHPGRYVKHG